MRYAFVLLLFSYLSSFHALPWPSAHSEAYAFLAALVWGVSVAIRNNGKIRINTPIYALIVLCILVALQFASGYIKFGGDALVMLMYLSLCITILLVAQDDKDANSLPINLAVILLFSAIASVFISLTQTFWVWRGLDWIFLNSGFRRPGANIGQPNQLGTLLLMGAASLMYLRERICISKFTEVALGAILVLGIAVVESRTCLLGAFALLAWWINRKRKINADIPWRGVVCGVLALAALVAIWPTFINQIHEPIGVDDVNLSSGTAVNFVPTTTATINLAAGSRPNVWLQLWHAILIKPFLGWGLGSVSEAHNAVVDQYVSAEPYTYAHNIVLDLAIGLGLPIAISVVLLVGGWLWRRMESVTSPESFYGMALVVPFGIHSLLEYPFAYAYFLIPAMLGIAMLEGKRPMSAGGAVSRKIILLGLVIFAVILVLVSKEYIELEEDFRVARFEALSVGQTPGGYERPNIRLLTQLNALVLATRLKAKVGMSNEDLSTLESVAMRFPLKSALNNYALALALNGKPEEAIRQLKVIRSLFGNAEYLKIRKLWLELASEGHPNIMDIEFP